jgi:hypothetical protein
MERDPDRQYADNFVGVLNLTRADLVDTYGAVWMSKSEFARDLMGSSRFVISRTTVAPKATQSDLELPQEGMVAKPGEIVLPKHMIMWLQMTYGMSEDFVANRSPSWVSWLDQQIIAGIDPNDAMLTDTFVPDLNEVLQPSLPEPVLVPNVYKHDQKYGVPEPGCSSQLFQSRLASSDLEGLDMEVDRDTAGSSSLDSMDQGTMPGDELNEAIKDEEIKAEDLGEPHEAREGGHGLCVDADQGRIVVPTLRGGPPYASYCTEFCLIWAGKLPYENYIYPAKGVYGTRECDTVDKPVSLTAGTLYPLLSNLAALRSYDQYHHILPLSILGRGGEGALCCRYMDTCKQWIKRQKFCEEASSMGYMTLFSVPWNSQAWATASKQYERANPTKVTTRTESCTLLCAMNPMGKLLIVQTLVVGRDQRIAFDLPDLFSGLLMDNRVVKICWDKAEVIRLCMNAGMPLAPVQLVDANLLTFLAFPQFQITSWVSKRLRTDDTYAADRMGMALVYHTHRHPRLSTDSSRVNEIQWDMSSSTETKTAWNADSLRYLRWKGTVGLILVEAMASRSLALTNCQPEADIVRVVHLICDRVAGFTWSPLAGNEDLMARRPFMNWMENNRVVVNGVEFPMKPYLIQFNDSVNSPWLRTGKEVIDASLNRARRYIPDEGCFPDMVRSTPGYDLQPGESFGDISATIVWDKILATESMFVPHPCTRCSEFNHDLQICPVLPEDVICIYCRSSGHNMQVCPQLNSYCLGCEIPGHVLYLHDLPLNIYEVLNNFRIMKKFGYNSCRLVVGPNSTVRVVLDEESGAWKMNLTTRLEVLQLLGAAPGKAPGIPFTE